MPTTCLSEGIGFAMHGQVVLLDATIVVSPKQRPVPVKESRPDRNPTLGHTKPRFLESNIERRLIIKSLRKLPRKVDTL